MDKIFSLWKKYSFSLLILFIIAGMFDLRIGLVALICMVGPIIISIFKGRFWCGNICPRGNFYDKLIVKISRNKKTPKILRTVYFRALVIALMMTVFITGFIKTWGNLYGMGLVVYRLIVVTTIVGITLSLFYNERTWCSFCPMGSFSALVARSRNKKNSDKLLFVDNTCVSCKLCSKVCPMDISPFNYKTDSITHHDCIQCGRCVDKCPKKSIGQVSEEELNRELERELETV